VLRDGLKAKAVILFSGNSTSRPRVISRGSPVPGVREQAFAAEDLDGHLAFFFQLRDSLRLRLFR
jgi:hypothetical protein